MRMQPSQNRYLHRQIRKLSRPRFCSILQYAYWLSVPDFAPILAISTPSLPLNTIFIICEEKTKTERGCQIYWIIDFIMNWCYLFCWDWSRFTESCSASSIQIDTRTDQLRLYVLFSINTWLQYRKSSWDRHFCSVHPRLSHRINTIYFNNLP